VSTVTRLLSRLIGVYCVIVSLAMASHRSATVETITAMVHNTPLLFLSGIIAVVTGLAIVLNHNVWSGGATPVIVTLIGWVTLLKGTLLLFLSPEAESAAFLDGLHFSQLFFVYCGIAFAMGAWLTWSGFSFRNNSC
jgi:hypothetical protein